MGNEILVRRKTKSRRFSLICRLSCSRMSLKIFSPLLTFATKHGRYLRKMDKRGIGTLSFVRASSEPVMGRGLAARPRGSPHFPWTLLPPRSVPTPCCVVHRRRGHAARFLLIRPCFSRRLRFKPPWKAATVKVWWPGRAESGLSSLDAELIC